MKLLVSCISKHYSLIRQRWGNVFGSREKSPEELAGLLCLVEDMGCTRQTIDLKMAAGMVTAEKGVLINAFDSIYEIDVKQGATVRKVVSSPLFNALHSLSRTRRGYVVASTGLDLLLEFNAEGDILWSWWAIDHGFELTPTGRVRKLDKMSDHRGTLYGTLNQTTHINSVAELPDGRFLASLFHQGMVIVIDRETGVWRCVLEGLDHPHAVRILDETHFTVADTGHGKALLVRINGDQGQVEAEVAMQTNWLQDCHYNSKDNTWVLVDGTNSYVSLRGGYSGEKNLAQFTFDSEWRLYEALML